MSEVEKPEPESPETLSFTLPRAQWSIIIFLAIRGVAEMMDQFVLGKAHTKECISQGIDAAKALQDLYKEKVPDAAKTVAADTLMSFKRENGS